jgi:hypothetical protein
MAKGRSHGTRGASAKTRRHLANRRKRQLLTERLEQRVLLTAVTSVAPLPNSPAALVASDVTATFDQPINPATASPTTFAIHSMQRGQLVGAAATVSTVGSVVSLDPASDFFPGELVQATVTDGIQSSTSDPATPRVWQFRTGVTAGGGLFLQSPLTLGNQESLDIGLGDLDGDGDLDAFVANRDSGNRGAGNRVWLNENGQFEDSGQSLGAGNSFGMALGDFDGDGDLDAFVSNVGEGNRIWINNGSAQFSDSGQVLGGFNSISVEVGDLDGDGDLDAFVANVLEGNIVWLNTGGQFSYNGQNLGLDNSPGLGAAASNDVSLGDVDGDGDLDAFVANSYQPNRVWLNDAGLFTDSGQMLGNHTSRAVSLGDLDADGDLDAFIANSYSPNRIWTNNGGVFNDSGQLMGNDRSYGIELGDLDTDGDLDAFVTNAQGNHVWRNQGGVFTDTSQVMGAYSSTGFALGDVDADGDLDAFVGNYSQNRIWINQNPTFSVSPTVLALPEGNSGTRSFDFTITRAFDVRGTTTVDYAFALGGETPAQLTDFVGGSLPSGTLTFTDGVANLSVGVDVVGDVVVENDEEFTITLSNPQGGGSVVAQGDGKGVIRNDEGADLGDLPAPFATLFSSNGPAHIAIGPTLGFIRDIDVDGQPAAGADGDDNSRIPDDEDGVVFPSPLFPGQSTAPITITAGAPGKLDAWIDFNRDNSFKGAGDQIFASVDVLPGTNNLTFAIPADASQEVTFARFRISTAGGLSPTGGAANGEVEDHTVTIGGPSGSAVFSPSGQSLGEHSSLNVALGDLDGDGDVDAFVVNGYNEGNRVWLNNGGLFTDSGQSIGGQHSSEVALGDLDGDGDLDAFVANATANRVFLNDGGVFTGNGQEIGRSNSIGVALGDLDGDGDLDAFVANETQANRLWLNDSGTFSSSGQILGNHASRGVALGDLDADGDLDAYVANYLEPNRVWLNNGGILSDSEQILGDHHSWGVALGDVDGDGDLDALTANLDHQSRLWLNSGGIFIDSGQTLGDHFGFDVAFGDLDGDGDLDAMVANGDSGGGLIVSSGNRVLMNNGGVFTDFGQPLGNHATFGVALGDLDGDGDLDGFTANYYVPVIGVPRSPQGNRVWLNAQESGLFTIAPGNADAPEGDSGTTTFTFEVTRAGNSSEAASLNYTLTGRGPFPTDAADFGGTLPVGVVNFAAAETTQTVSINVSGDTEVETDEGFRVTISDPVPVSGQILTATAEGTIQNDDTIPLTVFLGVDIPLILEDGGSVLFFAELSQAAPADITVELGLSGTAVLDVDYIISGTQIVIPEGAVSGSVTVNAISDLVDEPDETLIVEITSADGAAVGGGPRTALIVDDDDPRGLFVTQFARSATGFEVQLNTHLDRSDLNLFDTQTGGRGPADVVMVGEANGQVAGSLFVNSGQTQVIFVKTGGPLLPDTYTVTLRSADNAFKSLDGTLLDGNGDGTGGDDFVTTFTVGDPVAGSVTISIPDFVRGPGQEINVPADSSNGIPLILSDSEGVRSVELAFAFRSELFEFTSATVAEGMPPGATVTTFVPTDEEGVVLITFNSPSVLPAGTNAFVNLQGLVPAANANDNYRDKEVLDLRGVEILGADLTPVPVIEDDGFHVATFFGDVSANARINASDAALVARVAALIDSGFGRTPLADPSLVADVTGNGRLNAADASLIAQAAALLPVPRIPAIPPGVVTTPITGPDPKLSISQTETAAPGESIRVPVHIDSLGDLQSPHRLAEADLVVLFDNEVLTATGVTESDFFSDKPEWTLTTNIDNELGRIIVVAASTRPLAGAFSEELIDLHFTVKATAATGGTAINLAASSGGVYTDLVDENDRSLPLEGPVTNLPTDSVDGVVWIVALAGAPRLDPISTPDPAENRRQPSGSAEAGPATPPDTRYAAIVDGALNAFLNDRAETTESDLEDDLDLVSDLAELHHGFHG